MSSAVENAPLVELIAEVRWEPGFQQSVPAGAPDGMAPLFLMPGPELEEFFMRFGGSMIAAGYSETERLVPGNFPLIMYQPVYRFKTKEEHSTKSLYQTGPGLFSANAVPPYESWDTFGPVVRKGLEILIAARTAKEADLPFTATNLRYIDAFGENLTEGRSVSDFIRDVLGIRIDLPTGVSQHLASGSKPKPSVQFQIPMANGVLLSLGVGEGMANGQTAIMMDTSVATTLPVEPSVAAVMKAFDDAHKAIDATFRALIEPIKHLMPKKKES